MRNIYLGSKLKVEGTKKREHRKSFVLGRMAVSEEGCQERELGTSLVVQWLKGLPAMQETWVLSLGREDPLEKEMATHSSILAWRFPRTEEPGGL